MNKDPIKVQSNQYEEELPREKTQGEMVDIMAQELTNLPRFTACAKISQVEKGKQTVATQKIQTPPLVEPLEKEKAERDRALAIQNGHIWSKKRDEIEAEIRERQEKWRRAQAPTTPEPPVTPKPPPTSD